MTSDEFPPSDLATLESEAWIQLEAAQDNPLAPFRTATVATRGLDEAPQLRTVVLRTVDRESRLLSFYTDWRSPKVAELSADSRVSWLFYDASSKLQLRLSGRATLHHLDDHAAQAWAATSINGRRAYAARLAPGTMLDIAGDGFTDDGADGGATRAETERFYEHFVVIESHISRLDVLVLHRQGHRRASFDYTSQDVTARWRVP